MTLDHKTAEQLGLFLRRENPTKNKNTENLGIHNANMASGSLTCHICEKGGHTIITTSRGNKIIPYYVCEAFVKMSHAERLSKLESKNLCTICLFPGAVNGAFLQTSVAHLMKRMTKFIFSFVISTNEMKEM